MKLTLEITCPICGKVNELEVEEEKFNLYNEGKDNIQNIFPELSPVERELLITGICQSCWDKFMKEYEYDEDEYENEENF